MCENISNTTVCLLCPLGNKPLGHSCCPYGIASASVGQTNTCTGVEVNIKKERTKKGEGICMKKTKNKQNKNRDKKTGQGLVLVRELI